MTIKLYDIDSHLREFTATVTFCEEAKGGFALTLNRTAFFPEGGGQQADTGSIGPARVRDVQEKGGAILHYTDMPLPVGESFACALDFERRLRRMQNHTGEHIVSGLVYREFGFDNVGFHMGPDCMTMDYSGELSWEELMRVEQLANEAVRADLPIRAWYPGESELAEMFYRSKKEIDGALRLVEIPGIDRCACCAPHVARTGEVGVVKLLTAERHRGGVRVTALCGLDAVEDYRRRQESVAAVSGLLSVPRNDIAPAVARLLENQSAQKERIAALSLELARLRAETVAPGAELALVFDAVLDEVALRELVNLLAEKRPIAAAFSGSDETGWRYIIGSRSVDLRAKARDINAGINGRGGGSPAMIQGSARADEKTIRAFFRSFAF